MIKSRDQRNAKRISYICEIQCEGQGIKQLNTRINDISVTGLFIDSISCLPAGSTLKMKFSIMGVPLEVEGEVRHSIPQSGMGIQFTNLRPDQREVIECLVEGRPLDPTSAGRAASPSGNAVNTVFDEVAIVEEHPILMGNFAVIGLIDIIQMIETSRVTGTLMIQAPEARGEIYFNDGLIANAKAGSDFAISGLKHFISLSQGNFEFKKNRRKHVPAIRAKSNTGLLLELLATKDEEAAYS